MAGIDLLQGGVAQVAQVQLSGPSAIQAVTGKPQDNPPAPNVSPCKFCSFVKSPLGMAVLGVVVIYAWMKWGGSE